MRTLRIAATLLLAAASLSPAQGGERPISIGTNLLGYLYLGTINIDVGIGIDRHWSTHIRGNYNPFQWEVASGVFQDKKLSVSAEGRYWPWHTLSGWFFGGGIQYQRYNRGGIFSPAASEGDAGGFTLSGGYALMLSRRVNLEFGAGVWGGYTKYREYQVPRCGKLIGQGYKFFILPNDLRISAVFTF